MSLFFLLTNDGIVAGAADIPGTITSINPGVPWPGVDALGRRLPVSAEVGVPRANRFVGIFYFLYQGEKVDYGPFDATKIIAAHPEALS